MINFDLHVNCFFYSAFVDCQVPFRLKQLELLFGSLPLCVYVWRDECVCVCV